MAISDILKKKSSGYRCDIDPQGNTHCQIFEADKEGKMATGTDFTFSVVKESGCDPLMIGSQDILDRDQQKVKEIIEQRVRACKKGLG